MPGRNILEKDLKPNEALQVFDGVILSDGSLIMNGKNALFKIGLSGASHLDWLYYIKSALLSLGVAVPPHYPKFSQVVSSRGRKYERCILRSRNSLIMTLQHGRWYPNGKKALPENLLLSPLILAQWFMGDGSTSWRKEPQNNWVFLRLSTHCFSEEDNIILRKQLGYMGIIGMRIKHDSRNSLPYLENTDIEGINTFFNLVEPYIFPSYYYKVKRPWRKRPANNKEELA